MLKLTKVQCFLFGIGIIFLIYFANRFTHIIGSEKVEGIFVFYVEETDGNNEEQVYPILEYRILDSVYQFRGRAGSSYEVNDKVSILLQRKDHDQPLLYTLEAFWLYPLFYWILPILIWTAFSLSYINSNERIVISLKWPIFRKEKK